MLSVVNRGSDRGVFKNFRQHEHGIRISDAQKWIAFIIGTATLIIFMILLWNKRLQKEMTEKEQVAVALRESERALLRTGRFPDANRTALEVFGSYIDKHPCALFGHGICPDWANEPYGDDPRYRKKAGDS